MQLKNRRYELDWLRNFGILLLFPYHSARVFDHWDAFYSKNAELSWGLSYFIASVGFWFMPLLFWLAGSSSWYALESRTSKQYIRERLQRLLIPLVAGLVLIVPSQGYFAKLTLGENPGNYFNYMLRFFTDFSDLSGYTGGFSPTHLWFILYLFVLSLIALPFLLLLKKEKTQSTLNKLANVFSNPFLFLLLSIPISATQLLPSPGGQNPFYYLSILLLGYVACTSPRYQEMFNRYRLGALIMVLILAPTWMVLRVHNMGSDEILEIFKNINLLLVMIVLLGYGYKYLNFTNKWLSYMNEAAFPVYILHQSVLVAVAYYIVQLNIGIFPKFILIMVLTFIISVAVYEWVIKRTSVTRWLFGVKVKR